MRAASGESAAPSGASIRRSSPSRRPSSSIGTTRSALAGGAGAPRWMPPSRAPSARAAWRPSSGSAACSCEPLAISVASRSPSSASAARRVACSASTRSRDARWLVTTRRDDERGEREPVARGADRERVPRRQEEEVVGDRRRDAGRDARATGRRSTRSRAPPRGRTRPPTGRARSASAGRPRPSRRRRSRRRSGRPRGRDRYHSRCPTADGHGIRASQARRGGSSTLMRGFSQARAARCRGLWPGRRRRRPGRRSRRPGSPGSASALRVTSQEALAQERDHDELDADDRVRRPAARRSAGR